MSKNNKKETIIIGIDGNEANERHRVGVHQYAYEILWAIYNQEKARKGRYSFIIYLKNKPLDDLPKENALWEYEIIPGNRLWIVTRLMKYLLVNKRPDIFISPSHYLIPFATFPQICTIHDLGYLKFSGQFKKYDFWQLKYWSAISIYISKYIIAVSNSTKKDIVRHYPSARKKTKVILHGYDKRRFNNEIDLDVVRQVKKKYKIKGDYLLSLGTLKPSKNLEGLVEAYSLLLKKKRDIKVSLVIAGKKGWLFDSIFEKVKKLKLENNVIFTDFVDEKDKPALYKGAKLLVSPSYWEGFGMHIIEAMACGTPALAGKVASIPEVGGKAVVYVNPKKVRSIYSGMAKVLSMSDKRYNMLVEKSLERVKIFSWNKAAKEVLDLVEKGI